MNEDKICELLTDIKKLQEEHISLLYDIWAYFGDENHCKTVRVQEFKNKIFKMFSKDIIYLGGSLVFTSEIERPGFLIVRVIHPDLIKGVKNVDFVKYKILEIAKESFPDIEVDVCMEGLINESE